MQAHKATMTSPLAEALPKQLAMKMFNDGAGADLNGDDRARREVLLSRLLSKGSRYKYSRYGGLPLRYAGGKSLAVGYVVERIPTGIDEIASPFFGADLLKSPVAGSLD